MESVEERGRVFDSSLIASFKPLDTLERVIAGVTPKQVLEIMCSDPRWWERKTAKNSTSVTSVVHEKGAGRMVRYTRTVRVQMGPVKFRSCFYVSQFLDHHTIQMHCCEMGGSAGGHVVSRFRCLADKEGTRVVYEELMSAGTVLLKLGSKAIRTARLGHLEHLAEQVAARVGKPQDASDNRATAEQDDGDSDDVVFIEIPAEGHVFSDGEDAEGQHASSETLQWE